MRIYVPVTLDELSTAVVSASGARWDVPARRAHAVTPALAAVLPDDDEEGREYAAFLAAADDSLALVAARPDGVPLRAVASVEVAAGVVRAVAGGDEAPSAADVEQVDGAEVVAVHVDEPEAATDVRAVLAAVDAGDEEALSAAVQRVTDRDLLWYDPTEIGQVPRP